MAVIYCNGRQVTDIVLEMRIRGPWTADIEMADPEKLAGAVTLTEGALTWTGTTVRSSAHAGRTRARLIGGKGGLTKVLPCAHYRLLQVGEVVRALLATAGETLSAASGAPLLKTVLPHWTRAADTAGAGLDALADSLGAGWRVLPDGTVWFGAEGYPAQKLDEANELDRFDDLGEAVLASGSMELRPGVTYGGRKVLNVTHLAGSGSVRTRYAYEP